MIKRRVLPAGFIDSCIPILAHKPPAGPQWVHEIKHDGYRLIVRRDGERVRLFTRRGYDWTERFPAISTAAPKLRAKCFIIDGETVVTGSDGIAAFDELHSRRRSCSPKRAAWVLRASYRSGSTSRIAPADQATGSRRRTPIALRYGAFGRAGFRAAIKKQKPQLRTGAGKRRFAGEGTHGASGTRRRVNCLKPNWFNVPQ
jgi:hypothetical protein